MRFLRKPREVDYNDFNSLILKTLTDEDKHLLFYYSLFDPSGWEEEFKKVLELEKFLLKDLKPSILKIIRKADKNKKFWKKYLKTREEREHFFQSFVFTDRLTKFLISSEIQKREGINIHKKSFFRKSVYPDLIILFKGNKINVEIKRLVSCSQLRERFEDEIVKKLKDKDKTLLLFLFPQVEKDNPLRINQLIKGFYILEDYLKTLKIREVRVLCKYIEKYYHKDSKFSFNELIEMVCNNVFKIGES